MGLTRFLLHANGVTHQSPGSLARERTLETKNQEKSPGT
jgi:hypothetical protein